jgi:hypothetical protein
MFKGFVKKVCTSLTMIGIAAIAFASMGGGGNKNKSTCVKVDFTPVRTSGGFTLKAGPSYRGSLTLGQEKHDNVISFNSVISYQKGNTTYILPYKFRVQTFASGSNLQLLRLKLSIH